MVKEAGRRILLAEPYLKNEWKKQQLRGNLLLAAKRTLSKRVMGVDDGLSFWKV